MDTKPVKRSSKKEKRHHKIINISDDSPAVLVETGSHEFNTRKPVFENKEDTPPKKRRKKSLHSKKTDISQLYEQDLLKSSETVEDDMPTKVAEVGLEDVSSLSLMRCLHNKDLPLQRKIQLAHLFVESVTDEQQQQQKQNFDFIKKEKSWMGMPQLVSLMCYWIQSVLISSTKQNNTAQNSTNSEKNACLDVRCWVIFKWCLQSKYLERASFPSNLMRTINSVLSAAAAFPGKTRGNDSRCPLVLDKPIEYEAQTIITGAFMKEFAEVVRLLFSLHGRYIRLTLDLWASSALGAASLAERVLLTGGQDDYDFVFPNLTCLVLEEFARYLASHSNPRNVFPVIVEKLFEPLLSLLVVLEREQNLEDLCKDGIAYTWRIRLARILEDIFSFGLFHPVHIDGYLNVCKIGGSGESQRDMKAKKKSKSASSREREREDSTATFASYHKSLFQKLEYLRKEGKATALHGIGRLLSIYICRKKIIGSEKTKNSRMSGESLELINTYKQQQEIPHSRENSSKTSSGTSKNSNMNESKHTAIEQVHTSKHDQATVKPLFNLFVEFMDPLQMDVEHCENVVHLQETQKLQQLSCAHSTLVAINGLLFVVKDEKLFVPTEDTPEQAHFNYLKKIYNTVFKLGALVPTLCLNVMEGFDRMGSNANGKALRSKLQMLDPAFENLPTMIMKEIVLALSYLLEIEYRVADGELFDLWLLLLSYSAMNSGKNKKQEQSSMLNSQIVYLGCRIIIIYGELRQFFCRYLAVKICQKIRKSLPSKLNHLPFLTISPAEADFGNLQDWPKFINILEEVGAIADFEMSLYENTKNYKNVSTVMPVPVFTIEESQAITSCNRLFGDWINLLNLLCWLPKGYGDVKSASIYARHILNIERFLMTTLYQAQKASHSKPFAILQSSGIKYLTEFLDLFSACRRALKSITLSCNDDEFQVRRLSLVPILFESSSSCLWLLMSVDVVAKWFSQCSLLQPSLRGDQEGDANPWKHLIYSILDHTAGMLMIVCEGLFNIAAKSLTFDVQCTSDICKGDKLIDNAQISATDPISERNYMDVKTSVDVLAKTLSVQARDTLAYFKQISFDADQDSHESIGPLKSNCNRMNYPKQVLEEGKAYCRSWIGVIALTGGIKSITWGLASALNDLDEKCRKDRTGSLKWQNDLLVKWEHYGEGFECFVNFWIKKLLIVDSNALDEVVVTERDVMSQHDSKATFGHYRDAELTEFNREVIEARFGKGQDSEEEEEKDEAEQNGLYGGMDKADDEEGDGDAENDSLLELHASKGNVQHATFFEIPYLNKPFLEKLLKGKNPDQATLLGELFMVLAGIIKLKHLSSSPKAFIPTKNSQSTSLAFMNFHIGAAHWLISEASIIMTSGVFSLGWLVGIVRYLESIGSFIPYMNPTFPPMAYAKLINLHLQAMAAVSFQISLEIKNSVPEEVQFSNGNQCSSESTIHRKQRDNTIFNDLKTALRSSFSMLLKKPLQLHLVMALQSIERALTGAWTGYNIASQLNTGCQSGGNVGLIVAAGVECLDLTLDSVSGPKRMKLLAKYSSGFVAALLNVIMHLQGPQIFFVSTFNQCQERNFADPASVILVCVEVLSKFVLRHEVFAMRASHVGQSLALPGVLFQHLCQFKPTQCVSPRTMPLQNQARDFEKSTWLSGGTSAAVRKVSVELCISCCRLLCALLTNYGRESGHCISLLGDSLRIFLFCLEIVDLHTTEKLKAYCWTMQEGIKCACWLRRVYEEMGQHKTLGRYRVHILSDYISVVSGCGPAKSGLKREIDEALRSGAYALVHACSREDLQQLHVVLGEGPHRIALQTLINDCERYYNYKGKI
ncbi:uncharacterized protein LOC131035147 isoform X2 [Cryptomeria japonica]|uniref:uncharacterized protein LOC131035147 isoform X2 n=1 Tax=Cryptomeria japonica TaxID=3369 RepID=UPI0027DA08E5|nr:uncharacterized protein LOC131035147 isoform X2 [Cryptomeria japonica]